MHHCDNLSLTPLKEIFEGIEYIEEWKDIQGYEGIYKISSFGRVKALERFYYCGHHKQHKNKVKEFIKKQQSDKLGYKRIPLSLNGVEKRFSVHVLVAKAFIENPENKSQVNHKWGIKNDNRVHQLEWNTPKENNKHAFLMGFKKGCVVDHSCNQKLSIEQIIAIANSKEKGVDLAIKYNISPSHISAIRLGVFYSDITNIQYVRKYKINPKHSLRCKEN